jgi:hypothetical protein
MMIPEYLYIPVNRRCLVGGDKFISACGGSVVYDNGTIPAPDIPVVYRTIT